MGRGDGAHLISGLPEIRQFWCASRVNPTCDGARGWRGPLRALRGPVPRADQGRVATPALGRAPLRRKGLRLPALHQPIPDSSPAPARRVVGLISDPPSGPLGRQTPHEGGWRRSVSMDRNNISLGKKSRSDRLVPGRRLPKLHTMARVPSPTALTDRGLCSTPRRAPCFAAIDRDRDGSAGGMGTEILFFSQSIPMTAAP
jgi:hypothetical protein